MKSKRPTGIALKIRFDFGSVTAMGPGKADLLEAIIETGSISSAAKRMRMSYRRAWELVDTMNQCFKAPLVLTSVGGNHGGGASVTEMGHTILRVYRTMVEKTAHISRTEIGQIMDCLKE